MHVNNLRPTGRIDTNRYFDYRQHVYTDLTNYKYQTTTGEGIYVYVIDTDVNDQHSEYINTPNKEPTIDAQDPYRLK